MTAEGENLGATPTMLDLDPNRPPPPPKHAASVVLVRARPAIEVFCVRRSPNVRFLKNAIVFPGGRVDEGDYQTDSSPQFAPGAQALGESPEEVLALHMAARRELLEETGLDLSTTHGAPKGDFRALIPFARWITPKAEARRYDTRFFLLAGGETSEARHDGEETVESFWASPDDVLRAFEAGTFWLAPPTHFLLRVLETQKSLDALLRASHDLRPVCPLYAQDAGDTLLALPGDPLHPDRERLCVHTTRYVKVGEAWMPQNAYRPSP